jgi:hypothetical protein
MFRKMGDISLESAYRVSGIFYILPILQMIGVTEKELHPFDFDNLSDV